jgi:hypothetical protein
MLLTTERPVTIGDSVFGLLPRPAGFGSQGEGKGKHGHFLERFSRLAAALLAVQQNPATAQPLSKVTSQSLFS